MGKSLDFIKERVSFGGSYGISMDVLSKAIEESFIDVLNSVPHLKELSDKNNIKLVLTGDDNKKRSVIIKYNPDADFDYFTTESCTCDGTLYFMNTVINEVLNNVFTSATYNKSVAPENYENNLWDYDMEYIVGDFVIMDEFGEFGTTEKPWLQSRFTAMLPLICNTVRK